MSSQNTLKTLSNYKTGGECTRLYQPRSLQELQDNLKEIHSKKWPVYFLGGGTNSLVLDEFWKGAVISFHRLNFVEVSGNRLLCGAGAVNSGVCLLALHHSLSGLEWMYSLPGQIGGTIRMNARCYGGEISGVVEKVWTYTLEGEEKIFTPADGVFRGYKDTLFMNNSLVISKVELKLKLGGDFQNMREKMDNCEKDRKQKGHFDFPSCGCVFKNNYHPEISVPSGMLLDYVGAKQMSKGKAQVSPKHANFIYNTGGASSRDILELALQMREKVWSVFGVWLEFEMEILGELPSEFKGIYEKREHQFNKTLLAEMRAKFNNRVREY